MPSNEGLYKALPASRNLLIEHHMNMAYAIARSWSRERRRLRDDLEGQALLGLVKAAQALCHMDRPEYESYFYTCCKGEIQHLLEVERDHRGESLADYDSRISTEEASLRTDEMWDDVTHCLTDQERHILSMFISGHTVEAIGLAFVMSRAWAQAQLATIRTKVKDRL